MKKYITKADIFLLIGLVVIGLVCSIYLAMSQTSGNKVIIEQNGKLFGKYSLFKNTEVLIPCVDSIGSDVYVTIKDGVAYVNKSGCPNQTCVKHAPIDSAGESIVCIPNRVLVKIEGKGDDYDAITN